MNELIRYVWYCIINKLKKQIKMKTCKILMIIGIISFAFYSFTSLDQEEWKVPAKYEKMKNPTEPLENLYMLNIVSHVMVKRV
jgi:hypothetical protein